MQLPSSKMVALFLGAGIELATIIELSSHRIFTLNVKIVRLSDLQKTRQRIKCSVNS